MTKLFKKPHQQRAIDDIIHSSNGIVKADRAMFISACATGKTLTGLWAVEEYLFNHVRNEHKIAVFFFPSLALISQTYDAFYTQTSIEDYNPLVVCSETKIGQIAEDPEETPDDSIVYETCTNIENTKAYLADLSIKTKVIFVTYHSATIVGSALLALGFEADVGSFDEAHRTAQQGDTQNMSYALLNENFPIRKRLFMTATPKHITSSDEDEKAEFSMDRIEYYGEIAHELSMRQAINNGLICDYSIIAGAMESSVEINDENAVSVIAEAFIRGIKKTGVKTAIAFQKNIATSKAFAQWVATHYPDIQIRHIDGTMRHNERESIMQFLREGENIKIVTNSKILSEGVDAPAVDMVGFLSNIASEIDIVQRVGRVQRLLSGFPDKIGYVFVPIITNHQKEIIYGKESLFSVVANLRENDEQLRAEAVAFVSGGRNSKSVDVINLDDLASGGASEDAFTLPIIQNKISAILLGGASRREWEETFFEAKMFYKEHKKAPPYAKNGTGAWFYLQRRLYAENQMEQSRKSLLLEAFGEDNLKIASKNEKNDDWESIFHQLKDFIALHKRMPTTHKKRTEEERELGFWCMVVREQNKRETLVEWKKELIVKEFGIDFFRSKSTLNYEKWESQLHEVYDFFSEYGRIPKAKEHKTSSWVTKQRKLHYQGAIPENRLLLINELFGDVFFPNQKAVWNQILEECKKFIEEFGTTPSLKLDRSYDGKSLHQWLIAQKTQTRRGLVDQQKKEKLYDMLGANFFKI